MYRPVPVEFDQYYTKADFDYNTYAIPKADGSTCTCKDNAANLSFGNLGNTVRCVVTWLRGVLNYMVVSNPVSETLW